MGCDQGVLMTVPLAHLAIAATRIRTSADDGSSSSPIGSTVIASDSGKRLAWRAAGRARARG